jgi:hypothetical protein
MKPINIIVGLGALAVAGMGGWYMYMQSQPLYQKSAQRGLDPALFPQAPPSTAPAPTEPPPSTAPAPTEPPPPVSAPAAPSTGAAPGTTTP